MHRHQLACFSSGGAGRRRDLGRAAFARTRPAPRALAGVRPRPRRDRGARHRGRGSRRRHDRGRVRRLARGVRRSARSVRRRARGARVRRGRGAPRDTSARALRGGRRAVPLRPADRRGLPVERKRAVAAARGARFGAQRRSERLGLDTREHRLRAASARRSHSSGVLHGGPVLRRRLRGLGRERGRGAQPGVGQARRCARSSPWPPAATWARSTSPRVRRAPARRSALRPGSDSMPNATTTTANTWSAGSRASAEPCPGARTRTRPR